MLKSISLDVSAPPDSPPAIAGSPGILPGLNGLAARSTVLIPKVICQPFIVGELACGHLNNRFEILELLQVLPQATVAQHEEVLRFIDYHRLMRKGLGYVEVHLLAAALLTRVPLWTLDKKLQKVAATMQLAP